MMFNEPYTNSSEMHKKLTLAVAYYLLEDGQPAYTVERKGFQNMLRAFGRRYYETK